MFRTIPRRVAVLAAVVACSLPTAAARADLTQLGSGTLVNSLDIADAGAEGAAYNAANPDVTCFNPVVAGGPATVPVMYYLGELYGLDVADAAGHCMSYQGRGYTGTLTLWLEYQAYPGAAFQPIPGCAPSSVTSSAFNGALALVTPVTTCSYRIDSPAAGKPHRAHATLVNSQVPTAVYHGYSAVVWPGGVGVR